LLDIESLFPNFRFIGSVAPGVSPGLLAIAAGETPAATVFLKGSQ
jgi:hypothetical protein